MRPIVSLVVILACAAVLGAQAPSASIDAAMRAFWSADAPGEIAAATRQLAAAGVTYETLLARLERGRDYTKQRTGRVNVSSRDGANTLDNVIEVPADYDPSRAWPVRVTLHGGVSREAPGPGDQPARPLTNRIPSAGEIVIHPRAWAGSEWWTAGQVTNIRRLLARVKRDYNADESRVYVTGISDGGTGVYFLAMRDATPWAACLPLNAHPLVLANPHVGADGPLYAGNLVNCPLRVVNGGRDQLYPAASVTPFIQMFRRGSIPVDFQVYPDAGHDVSWWPQERPRFEAFLAAHRRLAHPEKLSWETERVDRYNRFRWLVIDRLGRRESDVALPDVNRYARGGGGTPPRRSGEPGEAELYDRTRPSGRVDATRRGNGFELQTRGVQQLTLLLSSDVIDFARPVRVTVNGRVVHEAVVKPNVADLVRWAAADDDRTMLYGAELKIAVP